jgi:TPR repeat protein
MFFLKTLIALLAVTSAGFANAAESAPAESFVFPQSTFRPACDAGDENSCVQVLVDLTFEVAKLDKLNDQKWSEWPAALDFAKACEHGSPTACAVNTLTNFFADETQDDASDEDQGEVAPPETADQLRSFAIIGDACDRDSALGCLMLGGFLAERKDPPEVERGTALINKAITLATQQCDRGDARICDIVAMLYEDNGPIKRDPVKAADLRLRGHGKECTLPSVCFALGQKYATMSHQLPNGARRDIGVAAVFFTKACDGGEMRACTNLGLIYGGGYYATGELINSFVSHAIPPDQVRMEQLLTKACDGGDGLGCLDIGLVYFFDKPDYREVKLDARSVAMFVKACTDPNVRRACSAVGEAYLAGHGVPRNLALAKDYFRKSCADDDKACLAQVATTGRAKPPEIGDLVGQVWH